MALLAERAAPAPTPTPAQPVEIYTRDGRPVRTVAAGPLDHQPADRPLHVLGDLVMLIDHLGQRDQLTHAEACTLLHIPTDELELLVEHGAIRSNPGNQLLDLRDVLRPRHQPINYRT